MPPAVLLDLLRAKPFVPFRIHLSDGTVYRIPHPDLVAPWQSPRPLSHSPMPGATC
jgi:hypothetical protein